MPIHRDVELELPFSRDFSRVGEEQMRICVLQKSSYLERPLYSFEQVLLGSNQGTKSFALLLIKVKVINITIIFLIKEPRKKKSGKGEVPP